VYIKKKGANNNNNNEKERHKHTQRERRQDVIGLYIATDAFPTGISLFFFEEKAFVLFLLKKWEKNSKTLNSFFSKKKFKLLLSCRQKSETLFRPRAI